MEGSTMEESTMNQGPGIRIIRGMLSGAVFVIISLAGNTGVGSSGIFPILLLIALLGVSAWIGTLLKNAFLGALTALGLGYMVTVVAVILMNIDPNGWFWLIYAISAVPACAIAGAVSGLKGINE